MFHCALVYQELSCRASHVPYQLQGRGLILLTTCQGHTLSHLILTTPYKNYDSPRFKYSRVW